MRRCLYTISLCQSLASRVTGSHYLSANYLACNNTLYLIKNLSETIFVILMSLLHLLVKTSSLLLSTDLLHCLYCTVLYCTVLYCTVLYCTVLHCTVLYCTVLYCTVLYCTVLYCTVLYCTSCTVLYCTVLYCTVLHCTVLLSYLPLFFNIKSRLCDTLCDIGVCSSLDGYINY